MNETSHENNSRKSETLEHLVCAQMDDHRDAAKLTEYAEKAKEAGETSIASYFAQKAKSRLTSAADAERYIEELIPSGNDDDGDRIMYRMACKRYQEDNATALKRRLEKLM